jgi:5'-3' exonuclease
MSAPEIVLIDLSSIAHPIWHMSQSEPDPNHTSQQIVARIRALASDKPHVAICCDSGRSFRHDIAPSYKANRPEAEAPLHHQIALARERWPLTGSRSGPSRASKPTT